MASFLKNLLLLIFTFLLSLLTFPLGILVFDLTKGEFTGIKNYGYDGTIVRTYSNQALSYPLALSVPIIIFIAIIIILTLKLNTARWFKFTLCLLFALSYIIYFFMADWLMVG